MPRFENADNDSHQNSLPGCQNDSSIGGARKTSKAGQIITKLPPPPRVCSSARDTAPYVRRIGWTCSTSSTQLSIGISAVRNTDLISKPRRCAFSVTTTAHRSVVSILHQRCQGSRHSMVRPNKTIQVRNGSFSLSAKSPARPMIATKYTAIPGKISIRVNSTPLDQHHPDPATESRVRLRHALHAEMGVE